MGNDPIYGALLRFLASAILKEVRKNPQVQGALTGDERMSGEGYRSNPARDAQIEQFVGTRHLPESQYAPVGGEGGPYYSLAKQYAESNINPLYYGPSAGYVQDEAGNLRRALPDSTGVNELREDSATGLGVFTAGYGKDSSGTYVSMYDNWNFDRPGSTTMKYGGRDELGGTTQPTKDAVYRALLNLIGKSFKVYDRFYFTPDTVQTTQGPRAVYPR